MKLPPENEHLEKSKNSWTREEEEIATPQLTPIYKLSMTSMVRNISIGQLGLAILPP